MKSDLRCLVNNHRLCPKWDNKEKCGCVIEKTRHPYTKNNNDWTPKRVPPHCSQCFSVIPPNRTLAVEDDSFLYQIIYDEERSTYAFEVV